jgi:hypothetical protein
MTAKWPVGLGLFVAGAVVGALVVTSRPRHPEKTEFGQQMTTALLESSNQVVALESQLERSRERVAKLEADTVNLASRAQELTKQAEAAASKPPRKSPSANPLAALFGGGEGGEETEAGKAMKGLMEAALKQQLDGKLGQMKTKLNLTPEQETAIRGILEKQFGQGRAIAEKMMTGKATKEELADVSRQQGNPEQAIKDLLSPEQQTAYAELQIEERRNNARLMANSELLQMQGALGLSQDQQDAVFQALYAETEKQFTPPAAGEVPDFRGALDRKLEALKPVLSAEQLQRYQAMQEQQLKLIESMLPKDGKPGDVVLPNVQVLPTPAP